MEGQKQMTNPRLCTLLLCLSSLLLNIYFIFHATTKLGGTELGWSRQAAAKAEAVAALSCSGHGRAFLDGLVVDGAPRCECNTCYAGPDCSELVPDCSADVDRSVKSNSGKKFKYNNIMFR